MFLEEHPELTEQERLSADVFRLGTRGKHQGNEGEPKGVLMADKRSGNDNDRYVQPNKERGGWDVVKELHKQASAHTDTKEQAINRARQIIRNQGGGELRIKNERGQLIDSDTISPGRESRTRDRK